MHFDNVTHLGQTPKAAQALSPGTQPGCLYNPHGSVNHTESHTTTFLTTCVLDIAISYLSVN